MAGFVKRMTSWRNSLPFFLAALLVFLAFAGLKHTFESKTTTVMVDMRVSHGSIARLYWNRRYDEPLASPLAPGKRCVYAFTGIHQDLKHLRLDPTNTKGANTEIEIFGITVEQEGQVLARFDPRALSRWELVRLEPPMVSADGLRTKTTGPLTPVLESAVDVSVSRDASGFAPRLVQFLQNPGNTVPFVIIAFAVFAIVASVQRGRRLHAPIVFAVALSTLVIIPAVLKRCHVLGPIDTAVGMAGFLGRSTVANQRATLLALGVAILIALGAHLVSRFFPGLSRSREDGEPDPEETGAETKPSMACRLAAVSSVVLLLGLLLLAFFPDVRRGLHSAQHCIFPQTWDRSNMITWFWLASKGYAPLRDFWYPYSHHILFNAHLPAGFFWKYAYDVIIYFGLFHTLFTLTDRKLFWPMIALFAVWVAGITATAAGSPVFANPTRYLSGIVIALSFVAIDHKKAKFQPASLRFGFYCCVGLFFEPGQVIYAMPPVAAVLLLDLIQQRPRSWRIFFGRMARDFGFPTLFSIGYCIFLVISKQFAGYVEFYFQLGDSVSYSSIATDIAEATAHPLSLGFLVMIAPMVLVALGLFERLRPEKDDTRYGDFLIAIGLCGFMMLQKHIVRPFEASLFIIPVLGLFGYSVLWKGRRSILEYVVLGAGGAVFAVMIGAGGKWDVPYVKAVSGPARIADGIQLLRNEKNIVEEANEARFADERFAHHLSERELAAWLRNRGIDGQTPKVYVLGDEAIVYILLRQQPPYQINMYNASPLYEQRKVVQWLRREKPEYVVWNPNSVAFGNQPGTFDRVQNFVRVPLIFNEVIASFVPEEVVGAFEVLRPRDRDEPIPVGYWREKLGGTADFGHFGRVSSFSRFTPCEEDTPECVDFLKVDVFDAESLGTKVSVPIHADGMAFGIELDTVPEERTYYVSMDRIWFWDTLKRNGYAPSLAASLSPSQSGNDCVNGSLTWEGGKLPGWAFSSAGVSEPSPGGGGVRFAVPPEDRGYLIRQGFNAALLGQRVRVTVRAKAFEPEVLDLKVYWNKQLIQKTHSGSGEWEDLTAVFSLPITLAPESAADRNKFGFLISLGPNATREAFVDIVRVEREKSGIAASIVQRAAQPGILY